MEQKTITNPVKAIRAKCLDCCCGSPYEVEHCTISRCELYPFRMGKNPYRQKRELSEAQRAALKAHAFKKASDNNAEDTENKSTLV